MRLDALLKPPVPDAVPPHEIVAPGYEGQGRHYLFHIQAVVAISAVRFQIAEAQPGNLARYPVRDLDGGIPEGFKPSLDSVIAPPAPKLSTRAFQADGVFRILKG
jgi:hypothetical protein